MPPLKRISQQSIAVGTYLLWVAFLLLGVSYVVTTIVSFNKLDSITESMLLKRVADVEEKNTMLMNVLYALNFTVSGIDVNMSLVPLLMDVEELKMKNATVRQVNTGVGLTGGPITQEGTISMETLDPDPSGTYGDANNIPQVTVDAQGRVVAATDVSISFPTALDYQPLQTTTINGGSGIYTFSLFGFQPSWGVINPTTLTINEAGVYQVGLSTAAFFTGAISSATITCRIAMSTYPVVIEREYIGGNTAGNSLLSAQFTFLVSSVPATLQYQVSAAGVSTIEWIGSSQILNIIKLL